MATMTIYRCPSCGGEIKFDSEKQQLACPYCDTSFTIDILEEYQKTLETSKADELDWEFTDTHDTLDASEIVTYLCSHCGGQIICDKQTVATSCPYCNSPVIMNENVVGELKPDYVIPFKLDKEAAKQQMKKHFEGKPFLPRGFKTNSFLDEIKGVYIPFWTYNCVAEAKQQYKATKVRYYSDSHYNYTKSDYYLVTREGTVEFDNVPVDAASKIDDVFMQSIEPFDFKEAVEFNQAYLAGYFADKYDEDSTTNEAKANNRIKTSTENKLASTVIGYSFKTTQSSNIQLTDKHVDYYLLPVWILNLSWNNKIYPLMMNGQTGKFIGDLPADMKQFYRFALTLFIIATAIVFGLLMFFR